MGDAEHPPSIAWPAGVDKPDGQCDMLIGKCDCGLTHTVEQVAECIIDHQIRGDVEEATRHLLDIQRKQHVATENAAQVQATEIARYAALVEQLTAARDAERESAANAERRTTETRRDYDELSERYEANVAKLGRACDVLKHVLAYAPCNCGTTNDHEDECPHFGIDAILADADSATAGETWRGLLAAYASHNQRGEDGPCECDYCKAFGGDARRGGGR